MRHKGMEDGYRVQTGDTGNPNLSVSVRVRPESDKELSNSRHKKMIKVLDQHVLVFDPIGGVDGNSSTKNGKHFVSHASRARDHKYAFDRVFDEDATQSDVYEATTKPLIQAVLNGFNATVFAYGATGAGKTHTMIGNASNEGVMVLTMRDLFAAVDDTKSEKIFKISISYLEVYNETIRDLFIENSQALMLCETDEGCEVKGLTEKFPTTSDEVFELLEFGNRQRRQSPTDANAVSSRSHAVLQIAIKQRDRTGDVSASVKTAKLSLIDLAGSERASETKNRGERLAEGANINKSLLALGNCINSLGENYKKGKHVPYRNSKLTRLLKDSLGGNCRTVMIANVSPSSLSSEDTHNTLKYSNRAKNIKTTVTRNVTNVNYHISKYTEIIGELRKEVNELKMRLQSKDNFGAQQVSRQFGMQIEDNKRYINRLEANLYEMREIMMSQVAVLTENNLMDEKLSKGITQANILCSPNNSNNNNGGSNSVRRSGGTKQAWVPKSEMTGQQLNFTPNSSLTLSDISNNNNHFVPTTPNSSMQQARRVEQNMTRSTPLRTHNNNYYESPRHTPSRNNYNNHNNGYYNNGNHGNHGDSSKVVKSILKTKSSYEDTEVPFPTEEFKAPSSASSLKKGVNFNNNKSKIAQPTRQPLASADKRISSFNNSLPSNSDSMSKPSSATTATAMRTMLSGKENVRSSSKPLYAPKYPPTSIKSKTLSASTSSTKTSTTKIF